MRQQKKKADEAQSALEFDRNALLFVAQNVQTNILHVLNTKFVTVAWQLGKLITEYEQVARKEKSDVTTIGLKEKYAAVLGRNFLRTARAFYQKFPDTNTAELVALFVPWSDIKVVLGDTSTIGQVAKNIRIVQSGNGKKVGRLLKHEGAPVMANIRKKVLKNWPAIEKAFRSSKNGDSFLVRSGGNTAATLEFKAKAEVLLKFFAYELEREVNTLRNMGFWELGKMVHELLQRQGHQWSIKDIGQSLTQHLHLGRKEEKLLASSLEKMALCYEAMQDAHVAGFMAAVVSWKHLLEIIAVSDKEKQIYFACLVAIKRLTPKELRSLIAKNVYGTEQKVKQVAQQNMKLLANLNTTVLESKKNSGITKITTIDLHYELPVSQDPWLQIFKGKELYQYLKYNFQDNPLR